MQQKEILYEYELILIGKKNSFTPYFFSFAPEYNERVALDVFKYASEVYLSWSPKEAATYLTMDIIRIMKLDTIIKYIRFPPELTVERDLFYIAYLLYPKQVPFNEKELVLRTYKEVLSGKLYKFPKEYLSDSLGMMRACVCFQYMVSQYLSFRNIEEMYEHFSSSKGTKDLKKYRLYAICTDMFEYPLDFLHEALPAHQKNEFLYHYYRFNFKNREQISNFKKMSRRS